MINHWHNCPNLAAFWYNFISAVVFLYSLYSSGSRYHSARINSNDPRYGLDWNDNRLLLYLSAILLSSLFWLLFLFSSSFKTGSLANDYMEIGTTCTIVTTSRLTWTESIIVRKILSRMKYHFVPFNSMVHLCGAFFLLVPLPLIIKEEGIHGIKYSDDQPLNTLLSRYTPEVVNFIMAAVSVTIRLPTVFLGISTQISIIFSFILFVANTSTLIRCVLHQLLSLEVVPYDIVEMQTVDVVIFVLSLAHFDLIYEMARTRYIDLSSLDQSSPKSAITSSRRPNILRYWPNILSCLLLIASMILSVEQYRISSGRMPLFFVDLSLTMFYFLDWLIILLLFTFKTDWHFKLPPMPMRKSLITRQTSLQLPNLNLKHVEPIYTCFQQLESVRSVSSESSRNHNQDFSSGSSSSSSHVSERVQSYKYIPSISRQLEVPEHNYEDLPSFRTASRQGKNSLHEITDEKTDQSCYFKSPNFSQRSSNVLSSDSGIGVNYRDHGDCRKSLRSPDSLIPRPRMLGLERHVDRDYDISEEYDLCPGNICSDV